MMTETQVRERLERIRFCGEVVGDDDTAFCEELGLWESFIDSLSGLNCNQDLHELVGLVAEVKRLSALVMQSRDMDFMRSMRQ